MRTLRFALVPLIAAAAVAACTAIPLNSDRIEARYGSYGVQLLAQDGGRRVTSLYSLDGGRRICRTHAVVLFAKPVPAALAAEHSAITNGGSIGATLRQAGWRVDKVNLHLGAIAVTAGGAGLGRRMAIEFPAELALHVYRLRVQRGNLRADYATILELHHPDYLDAPALVETYGRLPTAPLDPDELARYVALLRGTLEL